MGNVKMINDFIGAALPRIAMGIFVAIICALRVKKKDNLFSLK